MTLDYDTLRREDILFRGRSGDKSKHDGTNRRRRVVQPMFVFLILLHPRFTGMLRNRAEEPKRRVHPRPIEPNQAGRNKVPGTDERLDRSGLFSRSFELTIVKNSRARKRAHVQPRVYSTLASI